MTSQPDSTHRPLSSLRSTLTVLATFLLPGLLLCLVLWSSSGLPSGLGWARLPILTAAGSVADLRVALVRLVPHALWSTSALLLLQRARAKCRYRPGAAVRFGRALGLLLVLLMPSKGWAAEAPRIASIRIAAEDVFPEEAARRNFAFRTANRLHNVTRESLIRRFLLFREGDPLDMEVLAQTERNLRALEFLESASITVIELDDQTVDVEVNTRDSWTTEPGISVGSTGGAGHLGFELDEKNLFGSGRALKILVDEDSERTRRGIELSDPAFLRPYWQADLGWFENSDGSERRISVQKPFASIDSRWSFELRAERVDQERKLYEAGHPIELLRHDRLRIIGKAARRIGAGDDWAHRVSAGVSIEHDQIQPLSWVGENPSVADRDYRYLTIGYEYLRNGFIKRNYVNRDSRYEDFNLGLRLRADIAWSAAFGETNSHSGRVTFAASRGWTTGAGSFLLANLSYGTRFRDTTRNSLLDVETRWIQQYETRLPQTLVARASYRHGWELDRHVQMFADGQSGLRGYRLHAFEGDRILMVNGEHRISWGREIAHLFTPGAAIFVDSALINGPRPARGMLLRTDVGVGLRFALGSSTRNLLRFDLAFPLDPDSTGQRSPLFSFSSGHAF